MTSGNWDLDGPDQHLALLAARNHVVILRPLSEFRRRLSTGAGPLFFNGAGHMTPEGHRVMAEFLERTLIDDGLIPLANAKERP